VNANLEMARLRQEATRREQELRAVSETAQRAAEATRDQISNILESITDAFVAFDHQWRYTYVNQQATRLLHKTREELLGKQVWRRCFQRQSEVCRIKNFTVLLLSRLPLSLKNLVSR
jgi:PAS domain-containing protein